MRQVLHAVLVVFILSSLLLVAPRQLHAGQRLAGAQSPSVVNTPHHPALRASVVTPMLTAARHHNCALFDTGVVKCWGYNLYGQVGNGTTANSSKPVSVSGLISDVVTISAGGERSCALLVTGGISCWGYNGYGELGDGGDTNSPIPVQVSGLVSPAVSITTGPNHTCAVLETGGVYCWGANGSGQIGNGTTGYSSPLVQVSGLISGVAAVAAGGFHTCALRDTGAVVCWGGNTFGQLGNASNIGSPTSVGVSGLVSGVVALAAGFYHTCALLYAGSVACWGLNQNGQLGDGTNDDRTTPVLVSGLSSGVTAISAGGYFTCALLDTGGVQCWGDNGNGELGDGTNDLSSTPVAVSGLSSGVDYIAAGFRHACAKVGANAVKCWGYNGYSQLGNVSFVPSSTPVSVLFYATYHPMVMQ